MRQLYPIKSKEQEKLNPINKNWAFTEEDYKSLINLIDSNKESIESVKKALDDYKEQLLSSISTIQMTATTANVTNAVIDNLTSTLLESITANIENLTVDRITALVDASLNSANIDNLRSDSAILNEANITSLNGGEASFNTIKANTAEIDNYDITNLSATNATLSNATINKAEIESASVLELNSDTIDVVDLKADSSTLTNADIDKLKAVNIYNEFKLHNEDFNLQSISQSDTGTAGDYWIVLPKFVNGEYDLIGTTNTDAENGDVLWSIEIVNSSRNICFKWSTNKANPWLRDVEIIEDSTDNKAFIQIHVNTFGQALYLWHKCDAFDTTTPPDIYTFKKYEGKGFEFNRDAGMYLNNTTFAGEFHADKLLIDSVEFDSVYILKDIYLTTQYDQYGSSLGTTRGEKDQYITNTEDEYGNKGIQWVDAADQIEEGNNRLVNSDTVARWDGQTANGNYPIVHLGDGTVVHGDLNVENTTTLEGTIIANKHLYIGPDSDEPADLEDDAIVIYTNQNGKIYRRRVIDDQITYYELSAKQDGLLDQKPVIYDATTDTFTTVDELNIDTLKADNIVVDDLTVSGTAHINNTEEETVVGDFLTLRINNSSGLTSGQYSGLLVNNFKEGEICAIVVDNNGTARVGHATGTDTTFGDLYYHDNKYYTDSEYTSEVEPAGVMISWDSYEKGDDYEYWSGSVWRELNFDDTQPILTRKEETDLNEQGLLKYNKSTHQADTIPLPDKSEQTLTSVVTTDDEGQVSVSYEWKDKVAGVYRFANMEEYENYTGDIPVDSLVVIEDETVYVKGDDQ